MPFMELLVNCRYFRAHANVRFNSSLTSRAFVNGVDFCFGRDDSTETFRSFDDLVPDTGPLTYRKEGQEVVGDFFYLERYALLQ